MFVTALIQYVTDINKNTISTNRFSDAVYKVNIVDQPYVNIKAVPVPGVHSSKSSVAVGLEF